MAIPGPLSTNSARLLGQQEEEGFYKLKGQVTRLA